MRIYPLVFAAALAAGAASAAELIDKASPHDVSTTMDRLEQAIKASGAGVMERLDHASVAEGADMQLRPTQVVIFGSPQMGTPLMQQSQAIGLVLPLRVVVYEDASGDVHVAYEDMESLGEEFGVEGDSEAVDKVAASLEQITNTAVQE